MSKPLTGNHPFILSMLHALGIDTKNTVSVEIRVAVNEVVTVTQCRHVPEMIDVTDLSSKEREFARGEFWKEAVKYKLVPVDE